MIQSAYTVEQKGVSHDRSVVDEHFSVTLKIKLAISSSLKQYFELTRAVMISKTVSISSDTSLVSIYMLMPYYTGSYVIILV